jgi:hypothetical protein
VLVVSEAVRVVPELLDVIVVLCSTIIVQESPPECLSRNQAIGWLQ